MSSSFVSRVVGFKRSSHPGSKCSAPSFFPSRTDKKKKATGSFVCQGSLHHCRVRSARHQTTPRAEDRTNQGTNPWKLFCKDTSPSALSSKRRGSGTAFPTYRSLIFVLATTPHPSCIPSRLHFFHPLFHHHHLPPPPLLKLRHPQEQEQHQRSQPSSRMLVAALATEPRYPTCCLIETDLLFSWVPRVP